MLAAVAAALTIAAVVGAAGPQPAPTGPDAGAGQAAPGVVSESPGAHASGRTRSQGAPALDPGNTQTQSGNTRFYSPRGVAPPGETVTGGTADRDVTPKGGNRKSPSGG